MINTQVKVMISQPRNNLKIEQKAANDITYFICVTCKFRNKVTLKNHCKFKPLVSMFSLSR